MGAENSDYTRAVSRIFAVSCIKRIYEPGCFIKSILTLYGPQNAGKSTLFRQVLMPNPEWFTDDITLYDMRDKCGAEKIQGRWIVEVPEMAGLKQAGSDTVKAFLSRCTDKYRPAYGRTVEQFDRQCVIVMTVNGENGYLQDVTGNTRYLEVKVSGENERDTKVTDITDEYVKQYWAEALYRYRNGESIILPDGLQSEAEARQNAALENDDWEQPIHHWLASNGVEKVTSAEIWRSALMGSIATMKRGDSMRIAKVMKKMNGWKKSENIMMDGKRTRGYILEQSAA
jgi:predicted P-loop ATPase